MPERKPHVFNAGDCVWAKAQNFNYWPALILSPEEARLHGDQSTGPPAFLPVRFFGTYDDAWISASKNILPFEESFKAKENSSQAKSFKIAKEEAREYLNTKTLPKAFHVDNDEIIEVSDEDQDDRHNENNHAEDFVEHVSTASSSKPTTAKQNGHGAKKRLSGIKIRIVETPEQRTIRLARKERQKRILRSLALIPPEDP